MSQYRVHVRIELFNDDTDKLVTWDTYDHFFHAEQANGGHPEYQGIDDAISAAFDAAQRSESEGKS